MYVDLLSLGSCPFLTSILLTAAALVLPALSLDSLLCYFCPLQHKGKSCPNNTSQCLPHQHCSSSRGRYGPVHVLSAQGCVDSELCGSHEILSHRGVKYNVSHTCCCKDKCNDPLKPDTNLRMLIRMITERIDHTGVTNVTKKELWDSCAHYTSLRNSTVPAAAS